MQEPRHQKATSKGGMKIKRKIHKTLYKTLERTNCVGMPPFSLICRGRRFSSAQETNESS